MGSMSAFERKMYNDYQITEKKKKASVKCKCGHLLPHVVFNKKGWAICHRCGNKVLKPKDEFKNRLEALISYNKGE